jgi:1-acyl-sn-glycerol-3-phosphate acyltransferase
MYSPSKHPVISAFPDIKVNEPRISLFVILLAKLLARLYLFLFLGVARTVLRGEKHLFKAFERVLSGKSRCIIAFRHPNGGEPQLLSWFFLFKLRRLASKAGVKFARWPHAVFVYGYEVVRWGGWVARFIMPNVGAMPIHHSKIDSKGMTRIFAAITNGPYPVALAPEGQVSYTADAVPRLEPGVIRIGFQAAKQLEAKGLDCPLEILPISVHFRFGSWGNFTLELLLKRIEKICGFSGAGRKKMLFSERVKQCRDHILEVVEKRYQITSDSDASASFEERLGRVINVALETAERMLGEKGEGDFFARMYRVRQICWDRIFLPGVDSLEGLSEVERSSVDLKAGEAWYIARHMELVDFCWYFRIPLPTEEMVIHKKVEYVQNLWDFASRSMGGAFRNRVSIFPRRVIIHSAPVINLSERLPAYNKDKKAELASAMSDLERAFLDCIAEANGIADGRKN